MAIVKGHKITATLNTAIDYVTADKPRDNQLDDDINRSIDYASNDKSDVYKTIRSSLNCNPLDPKKTFNQIMDAYAQDELKNGNRQTKDNKPVIAWHFIQSFEPGTDPELVHQIGREFAKEVFGTHPVIIGTHTNTDSPHNHFIVCAWDTYGKKWHQHNAAYQHMREVSDKLCEKYELNVLDNTRTMKLHYYTDKKGARRAIEVTDRKLDRMRQRDEGQISPDDVNSYRNTNQYDEAEYNRESGRATVVRDINRLLPLAESYDHLVDLLKQNGYKVRYKAKDGSYLKFTSFTPPGGKKGFRDSSLARDGYYTRGHLEQVISGKAKPEQREYRYGDFDLYRNPHMRTPAGKVLVEDIKDKDSGLRQMVSEAELRRIVREQERLENGRKPYVPAKKQEKLVKEIRGAFKTLSLVENERVLTHDDAKALINEAWKQYHSLTYALSEVRLTLGKSEPGTEIYTEAQAEEARLVTDIADIKERINCLKDAVDVLDRVEEAKEQEKEEERSQPAGRAKER